MQKIEITKEKIIEASKVCEKSKEVLETLFPEVFKEELIPVGSKFYNGIEYYILAQVDRRKFTLINLKDGNRYIDPVSLEMAEGYSIKYSDLKKVFSDGKFELVK